MTLLMRCLLLLSFLTIVLALATVADAGTLAAPRGYSCGPSGCGPVRGTFARFGTPRARTGLLGGLNSRLRGRAKAIWQRVRHPFPNVG